jgi:hypothetical protein
MEITILLADSASVNANGNLDVLGLAWDITGPSPLPGFTIVVLVKVPLDWPDGKAFDLALQLQNSAGEVVKVPAGEVGVRIGGKVPLSAERPPSLQGGMTGAATVPPGLILEPGVYQWVASVQSDSSTLGEAHRAFYVRGNADEFPPQSRLLSKD